MNDNPDRPFTIDPEKIPGRAARFWVRLLRRPIERILRFPALNDFYAGARKMDPSVHFAARTLSAMGVTWREGRGAGATGCPIPETGPVVVVANHPFGGIEGVVMLAMLAKYRPDCKALVNFILSMIPDLRKDFFFVNPFGGNNAKRENMKAMRESLKWLEEGHVLVVFPAGEVSSLDRKTGLVRDIPWSTTIARMIRKTEAAVVPVFFAGDNGRLFSFAGRIHPRLRTILLPHELVNKRGKRIDLEFGDAIPAREMAQYATDEALTTFLRLRTYILAERVHEGEGGGAAATSAPAAKKAEIVAPVDPGALEREIASLPESARLCEGDGLVAYCAGAGEIPETLREIGRLREITYREVGEGTNGEIDLDSYDRYYLHLFLWNPEKREIAGAYRLGLSDEIVRERGAAGLYIRTCFDFDMPLIEAINPAIELGRSFIRREYQRAFSSLMLLWKGICLFIYRNSKYRSCFGPVSISNDYLPASKELIMKSLKLAAFSERLAPLVKSKLAPKPLGRREWLLPEYEPVLADLDAVSKLVQEIEPDGRPIPILVKQYIKMGGKVVCFNVDPDFNYCIDGMVAIDIADADERMMRRYMGSENFSRYLAEHGRAKGDAE